MSSVFKEKFSFEGKRVYVIGLGEHGTGREAALALAKRGAAVTVADEKSPGELSAETCRLEGLQVRFELAERAYGSIRASEMVVISPGVPPGKAPLESARAAGIPVVSEIEIAYMVSAAPIIAITGTKGKTTTAALVAHLLSREGRSVRLGGNIGSPLVSLAAGAGPEEILVAEVSSFQLEAIDKFRPWVAAFLNFSADHLDRHVTIENYWRAKVRIFENQADEDFAVLNAHDARLNSLAGSLRARVLRFSRQEEVSAGVFVYGEWVVLSDGAGARRRVLRLASVPLPGAHNLDNVLAAVACASAAGVSLENVENALASFRAGPHRLEEVACVGGVTFIDDSEATTPSAVAAALEAFQQPIILIAGGQAKVDDFGELGRAIARRAKVLLPIGEAGPTIAQAAARSGFEHIEPAGNLEQAVRRAFALAQPGDVVLLSPACASFDQFKNLEQRGEAFKAAVAALAREHREVVG